MTQSITIKLSNGTQHTLHLPDGDAQNCSLATITINQLKALAAEVIGIPPEQQRMVYRGKVLRGNSENGDGPLSQFAVEDGHTIHVVKGQAPKTDAAPSSQATDSNNHTPISGVSPAQRHVHDPTPSPPQVNPFAAIFNGANVPIASPHHPQTGQGFGLWPPMAMDPASTSALLNNPMMMQAAQQMMQQNPQLMQQMMASNPMLANLPPAERDMYSSLMQNPQFMQQMMSGISAVSQQQVPAPMANMMNPRGINPYTGMYGGVGNIPGAGQAVNPSVPPNPREVYATQLGQLQAMGFPNEGANIAALQMSNGSVEFAIEKLLSSGSGF
eukprot:Tbor_TRINITY_DN5810_c4_g6::TRINITY_DN5810_c4_g6_i1::g.6312::m.6312/K04523/UBQLN, DSK2; ubiquilin